MHNQYFLFFRYNIPILLHLILLVLIYLTFMIINRSLKYLCLYVTNLVFKNLHKFRIISKNLLLESKYN
jgi:hypothetical protein